MADDKGVADNPPTLTDDELDMKTPKELNALLLTAKRAMSKCVLESSWTFTVPAVLVSVPLGIRFKTYSPLVFAAITASGIDYYNGMRTCDDLKQNIDRIKYVIALKTVGDDRKAQFGVK